MKLSWNQSISVDLKSSIPHDTHNIKTRQEREKKTYKMKFSSDENKLFIILLHYIEDEDTTKMYSRLSKLINIGVACILY